ncbi:MAG: C_GCAxxG_C_C family protein, partial [Clostridia bacterium]|nr:C_GCAxxG_C_C family protein [Clostridia bacterium]
MKNSEKAVKLFTDGYNCAQAVFGAFAEDLGFDEKTALKISAPFGGGFGRQREVCGAVSGMLMAFGY